MEVYRRRSLDREIPGYEGDVDPFYKNTLDKSIVDGWWTKLFPDAFEDDFFSVVDQITKAEFPNLFEYSVVDDLTTVKKTVDRYTIACLSLRNKIHNEGGHRRETGGYSVYSVYSIDRGLYSISKSMVDVLERYFDEVCNLHCFKDDMS